MQTIEQIRQVYKRATQEFIDSPEFTALVAGQASTDFVREFLRNVFRTHYLSSHIVAMCYAALPSDAAALLKENLLEEMGHNENEPPHSALLLKLVQEIGMGQSEIDGLINDARRRVSDFSAVRVPFATLREICLAVLLETLSFEFMLAHCSGKIATALRDRYGIPKSALTWFELHSEVDIRHAEEGLTVIQSYLEFHRVPDATFELIARHTLNKVFTKHYFSPAQRSFALLTSNESAPRIETVTIHRLAIPFHQAFRHASQNRDESDAVILRVRDSAGNSGYGEALPRPYVTGETTALMIAHLRERLVPQIFAEPWQLGWLAFDRLAALHGEWTRSETNGVRAWNAAFCAAELALLDWSLRQCNAALADFLPPARNEVIYSGVISSDSPKEAAALARRMTRLGITQIKIKVGTPDDDERVAAVRQAVEDKVELRADANGMWSTDEAIAQLKTLAPFGLVYIEQPVAAADFAGLRRVREATGIPVMADESLVTIEDARKLIAEKSCQGFNIRLSKNGGITGSLAIAKLAREAGMQIQVGAQVGETAILSAAGRTFAAHQPELISAEGSFGTWLLSEDIAFEDLSFGYAGIAPLLRSRGLSVTVKDDAIERLTVEKVELKR